MSAQIVKFPVPAETVRQRRSAAFERMGTEPAAIALGNDVIDACAAGEEWRPLSARECRIVLSSPHLPWPPEVVEAAQAWRLQRIEQLQRELAEAGL